MTYEYAIRQADPRDREDFPDATEVVLLRDRKIVRVMGVFEYYSIAELIISNLNEHAEYQIR